MFFSFVSVISSLLHVFRSSLCYSLLVFSLTNEFKKLSEKNFMLLNIQKIFMLNSVGTKIQEWIK